MHKLALLILAAFSLLASPAMAEDRKAAAWIVSQMSGDARVVRSGLQPASLKVNARLSPGDTILTGPTGRATLVRGADYIVMAPRSELRLPAAAQANGFTRVMQSLGTMLFKIKHTGVPHFAVDTPMLAAVVKGTTFTVVVDKDRSAVQVTEGAVEVTANQGGMSQIVERGRIVYLNHSTPTLLIDGDAPPAGTVTTTATGVKVNGSNDPSVAAIAVLTGGLVTPGPAPAASTALLSMTAQPMGPGTAQTGGNGPSGAQPPVAGGSAPLLPAVTTGTGSVLGSVSPILSPAGNVAGPPATPAVQTVAQAANPVVAPVTETEVAAPVVEAVAEVTTPVVETVAEVTTPVVAPVAEAVAEVTTPVVETVAEVTTPVVEPVVEVVADVTEPAVAPIVEVVTEVTEPVVAPVVEVVAEVTEPVVAPVVEVVTEVLPVLGGLSGL